jgi:hypothetical protein
MRSPFCGFLFICHNNLTQYENVTNFVSTFQISLEFYLCHIYIYSMYNVYTDVKYAGELVEWQNMTVYSYLEMRVASPQQTRSGCRL